MPTDNHTLTLTTQQDGTIQGIERYYFERWSMWSSEEDGFQENPVTFENKEELIKKLKSNLQWYTSKKYTIALDHIRIMENGTLIEIGPGYV